MRASSLLTLIRGMIYLLRASLRWLFSLVLILIGVLYVLFWPDRLAVLVRSIWIDLKLLATLVLSRLERSLSPMCEHSGDCRGACIVPPGRQHCGDHRGARPSASKPPGRSAPAARRSPSGRRSAPQVRSPPVEAKGVDGGKLEALGTDMLARYGTCRARLSTIWL